MRLAPLLALLVACSDDPEGAGKGIAPVGGDDDTAVEDTAADDTGEAEPPPDPAWVQVGNDRVPATHVVLSSAGEGDTFDTLTLATRGWAAVGIDGSVAAGDASTRLSGLDVDLSDQVDTAAWNQGELVPPELCDEFVATWTLAAATTEDGALALAPSGEERCVVEGTQRAALLTVDFGEAAAIAFSSGTLTLTLGDGSGTCTLEVVHVDEVTLTREVDCATSVAWQDGAASAVPGAARYLAPTDAPAQLIAGVVPGAARVVGQP